MTRRKFNKEMYEYLVEHGNEHILKDWVNILNKKYSENFTLKDIQNYFSRHKIAYKYEYINRSRNNAKSLPIGSEYTKPDGMVRVKINKNTWVYKQRYIYEKYHNVKLSKNDFVIFLDNDRNNFDINNLYCVSCDIVGYMANQDLFTKDKELTKTGIYVSNLVKMNKKMERTNNDRRTKKKSKRIQKKI